VDTTDRQMTSAESTLLQDLRAGFSEWTIGYAGGVWLAVRSGVQEHDGPGSLIMRGLTAASLPELAALLAGQAHLDRCSDAELEEIWRDSQADLSVCLYPVPLGEERP